MASPSSSALFTASFIVFIFFQLSLIFQASSARGISMDPTEGFMELPFNASFYEIQHPYNVQEDRRYSFVNGVHKLWVFRNDKPHFRGSHTKPRTEIGIEGYSYSSGVWQFEGYGYVPQGTNGVCIMQVFGATEDATTLMLHVYNGALHYYEDALVAPNIVNRWFRLNVIHDVSANNLKVFIDGQLKLSVKGRGRTTHFFKCGVYTQLHASNRMESQWRNTTTAFALSAGVGTWNAVVFEIVMTFGLVYTVYATAVDPKKGDLGTIAPIAIGFIVGANILVGGAFTGASMNPAVSFGPALVSWSWESRWVYWAGPIIGGGLTGLIYELFFINRTHEQLPTTGDY